MKDGVRGAHAPLVGLAVVLFILLPWALAANDASGSASTENPSDPVVHKEEPVDPPPQDVESGSVASVSAPADVVLGPYRSVQVNVNANGENILGDAANEPSIAVDPGDPSRMVIGWRQFDSVSSHFRQAGNSHSSDGGVSWNAHPVIDRGQFRSDPVLGADADGNFYYYSLSALRSAELFKSIDGGASWSAPVAGTGGDKAWMAIDRTSGIGQGNIYVIWNIQFTCCSNADFARSINGGLSFEAPRKIPEPSMKWGTLDVGPDGELYSVGSTLGGSSHLIARSSNARDPSRVPSFDYAYAKTIDLGGATGAFSSGSPNPGGLLGQVWVATDHSTGPTRGNVYVLGSVEPAGNDPRDVMFIRSTDGGANWSAPVRINNDSPFNGAYQWFGTMSVAPNGRIDVIWNDTRAHAPAVNLSALYYAYSLDGGLTWSANIPLSPPFDSHVGWPQQNKLGDYYDMISDNGGVDVAYAATFNGEQDVYYLRIGDRDCNGNDTPDADDIASGFSEDCNLNEIPDDCERDCNDSGKPDHCDVVDGTSEDCNTNLLPDECDADFDGDGIIDDCDPDRDGDGVDNGQDHCSFTPLGMAVNVWGQPVGDSGGDCVINLIDHKRLPACLYGPEMWQQGSYCSRLYDFPQAGQPADTDVDLRDFAEFQKAFGRE